MANMTVDATWAEREQVAGLLHNRLCHWNHTDGCSWGYESWSKPAYSRNEYLKKADNLLRLVSFDLAKKIVEVI